jgi:hypothetical protein
VVGEPVGVAGAAAVDVDGEGVDGVLTVAAGVAAAVVGGVVLGAADGGAVDACAPGLALEDVLADADVDADGLDSRVHV